MDMNGKDVKSNKNLVNSADSPKVVLNGRSEGDDESQALLPSMKGGLSKKSGKPRRKVQWLDKNGDKLAEILEFQPSDTSDSDEDDSDSCICRIIFIEDEAAVLLPSRPVSVTTHFLATTSICSEGVEELTSRN